MSCWEILGLEPGDEQREIKRRFAQLVKVNRPEEDPQAYQRLRDAYEQALASTDDHRSQPNVEPCASAGVRPLVLPRVTPVSPPPPVIRENGWAEVLETLLVENKRLPEAADWQLERALVDLVAFDLQSRLQFETTLMAKLARDHRPLLMLAAAEKFKWHLVTDKDDTGARSTINDHYLIYRRIERDIAPLFFNGMSCIDEIECGEKLSDIYAALQHDAQSLQWFDTAVLLKIAGFSLSSTFLGFLSEKIEWAVPVEQTASTWSLSERFYSLSLIHHLAYEKVLGSMGLESGHYHVSKVVAGYIKEVEREYIVSCYGQETTEGWGRNSNSMASGHPYRHVCSWLTYSAEQGDAHAQHHLGWICERMRNNYAAVLWYAKAAEQGFTLSQSALARLYIAGSGISQDYPLAIMWFTRAAEQNCDIAKYNLAILYRDGIGVNQDKKLAFDLFHQAALQGNWGAQNEVAKVYDQGDAAAQNYQQALHWYNKAAEQGHRNAQYRLGKIYSEGIMMSPDYQRALSWYSKAAEQGSADAMFELGYLYYTGEYIAADIEQAVHWFSESGQRGVAQAAFILAEIYATGKDGVKKDESNACYWYEKAARLGSVEAQGKFAAMYALGTGKEQNYLEAWAWIIIAGGDNPHIDKETVLQKLSAEEMAEAQAMAARYRRIFQLK